jgi:Mg2+ and Co2+ transporter CorA
MFDGELTRRVRIMDDDNLGTPAKGLERPTSIYAAVASTLGVECMVTSADLRRFIDSGHFFWLDIVGSDAAARAPFLRELGLKEADSVWVQRFGQMGRMTIGQGLLRAATRFAESSGSLAEIHLLGSSKYILTVWNGDAAALNEIRVRFAEQAEDLEKSPYQAAAVVLQLLLGTLDQATSDLDVRLQAVRRQLEHGTTFVEFKMVSGNLGRLRSEWSSIDRYSSVVRSAIVGIETWPEIDQRGVSELKEYADQVEDVAHRLRERYQWGADILQQYAAQTAQHQSEQINRLTLVSLIFLPITFLTGFFGMNFNWMINTLGSQTAFFCLGILLPAASVITTLLWFKRRGLMFRSGDREKISNVIER